MFTATCGLKNALETGRQSSHAAAKAHQPGQHEDRAGAITLRAAWVGALKTVVRSSVATPNSSALVSGSRGEDETGIRRVTAGGGKRKLASEVRGRLDSIEWRVSVLEQRVGTGPDVRDLDREIIHVRRDKQAAIDAQDFENAAVLRDRESQLLSDKAARLQEWAALPSLSDEVERLRDLLRRHDIDPRDGAA